MAIAERIIGTITMMATLVLATGPAVSQVASREVLLGVSRVGRDSPPADSRAGLAYGDAIALIRSGDTAAGQRLLEQLVAAHPESDAASRARRDLALIYAALARPKPLPAPEQVSYLGRPDAISDALPRQAGAWRTSIRPAAGFEKSPQDGLRGSAGDLVFFSEGSADLGARARKALAAQAVWLAANAGLPIVIEGHADDTGAAEELRALSARRAQAVRARLIAEGIAAERITIIARGDTTPIVTCADQTCGAQNRRAVTLVGDGEAALSTMRMTR